MNLLLSLLEFAAWVLAALAVVAILARLPAAAWVLAFFAFLYLVCR